MDFNFGKLDPLDGYSSGQTISHLSKRNRQAATCARQPTIRSLSELHTGRADVTARMVDDRFGSTGDIHPMPAR
jgi:hypothetical protein